MSDGLELALTEPRPEALAVRTITPGDLLAALREGWRDFMAKPSHVVFLCVIYPVLGLFLGRAIFSLDVLPLLYPLAAGFALIGPFAAIGLYELSRRREQGLDASWGNALDVVRSPAIGSILTLGFILLAIFMLWMLAAHAIYDETLGDIRRPDSIAVLVNDVFTSRTGLTLLVVGNLVGFFFAAFVLAISVVSFPLLLDRNVGVSTAVQTSVAAVRRNPVTMALWGLVVAAALALGSLPLFIGLAVVVPVLGHATWHLYRRVVEA